MSLASCVTPRAGVWGPGSPSLSSASPSPTGRVCVCACAPPWLSWGRHSASWCTSPFTSSPHCWTQLPHPTGLPGHPFGAGAQRAVCGLNISFRRMTEGLLLSWVCCCRSRTDVISVSSAVHTASCLLP